MTGWPKHALALALLAAISLGLYGKLYSPLDHAYPEGEAASASVTRFIAENPNPWGWNPTWAGGEPTQTKLRPAFHYAAALVAKFGNEPIYAHRIVAVTMALLAPVALYAMVIVLGGPWLMALAASVGLTVLSPIRTHARSPLSFLPSRLSELEQFGDAPYLAGLTLVLVAVALVWRAAHRRDPGSLWLAALGMVLVALSSGEATLVLTVVLLVLELTMLGIAGEYRFSHRRVFGAVLWAIVLSGFAFTDVSDDDLTFSFRGLAWKTALLMAMIVRLLFLGRRQPLLCFVSMGLCVLACFRARMPLTLEIFFVLAVFAWMWKAFEQPRHLYRLTALLPTLLLCCYFDPYQERVYPRTLEQTKLQVREWRGDWGMKPPSESEAYKLTSWFVQNAPRGRIVVERGHPLVDRLNAWVPFAQVGAPGQWAPELANLHDLKAEYLVVNKSTREHPIAYQSGNSKVYRFPLQSLATSIRKEKEGPPLELEWITASHIRITGIVPKDHSLAVNVRHHPGWQSSIPIGEAQGGLMNLAPPPGPVDLHLEFKGTRLQHLFGYLSAFTWVASLVYVAFRSRRA